MLTLAWMAAVATLSAPISSMALALSETFQDWPPRSATPLSVAPTYELRHDDSARVEKEYSHRFKHQANATNEPLHEDHATMQRGQEHRFKHQAYHTHELLYEDSAGVDRGQQSAKGTRDSSTGYDVSEAKRQISTLQAGHTDIQTMNTQTIQTYRREGMQVLPAYRSYRREGLQVVQAYMCAGHRPHALQERTIRI